MLLEEFLRPGQVGQRQFAAKLGCTTAKLNELVKGKRGVTADTALDLAEAFGTSPPDERAGGLASAPGRGEVVSRSV